MTNCFAKWQYNTILAWKMIAKIVLSSVRASFRRDSSYETCIDQLVTQREIMGTESLPKEQDINGDSDEHQ